MAGANAIVTAFYSAIDAARSGEHLDAIQSEIWRANLNGHASDDEAQALSLAIHDRRRPRTDSAAQTAVGGHVRRAISRFQPRQRPRSPDRVASRDRRRRLGGSSALPDTLRHHYTEGQRAVLCIIAGEVREAGACDLPIDKIAALAGVCRTTVQTTLFEARRLGHLKITERRRSGRKNLTNIVEIISREWSAWIKRGPKKAAAHRVQSAEFGEPHEESSLNNRAQQSSAGKESGSGRWRKADRPWPTPPAWGHGAALNSGSMSAIVLNWAKWLAYALAGRCGISL